MYRKSIPKDRYGAIRPRNSPHRRLAPKPSTTTRGYDETYTETKPDSRGCVPIAGRPADQDVALTSSTLSYVFDD